MWGFSYTRGYLYYLYSRGAQQTKRNHNKDSGQTKYTTSYNINQWILLLFFLPSIT